MKFLVAGFVWLMLLASGVAIWKYWVAPVREQTAKEEEKIAHKQAIQQTGSSSRYKNQINFGLDSFSGYAVFRSSEFEKELENKQIKLNLVDDKADYVGRLKALAAGDLQMSVFTIDALIVASAELGDLPASIIAFVDETRGADAMVAYKSSLPNLDALNNKDVRFVLTPNSPSETLARVVISHFGLSNLDDNCFIKVNDAEEVYKKYLQAKPNDKLAFILWEPYVTKILENPNTLNLVDSSRFRGYTVDVIVANRDFLLKNELVARDLIECYLKSLYYYNHNAKFAELIVKDSGTPLNAKQTDRLINGIWWKNTSENYAHMGLNNELKLQHVEDMINNITRVLISTNAIAKDPTNGQPNLLYYNKILSNLKDSNFHPGFEENRDDSDSLPSLTNEEWTKLVPVGTLQVPSILFARGTARISEQSQITLNELIEKLATWPQYYLIITGNASLRGDIEANKALAKARADSVKEYLLNNGVSEARVRSQASEPTGNTDVVFQLGYVPY